MTIFHTISVVSALIAFGVYIPYFIDILSGKAKPARSARIMLTALLIIALFQQRGLGGGWTLAVTIGEAVGAIAILAASLKRGVGGLNRLDLICYLLLFIDVLFWVTTDNTLVALYLTVIADVIAFGPTLIKTWRHPKSETPIFFLGGFVAPILSIVGGQNYSYAVILFPLYISIVNGLEIVLIYRYRLLKRTISL